MQSSLAQQAGRPTARAAWGTSAAGSRRRAACRLQGTLLAPHVSDQLGREERQATEALRLQVNGPSLASQPPDRAPTGLLDRLSTRRAGRPSLPQPPHSGGRPPVSWLSCGRTRKEYVLWPHVACTHTDTRLGAWSSDLLEACPILASYEWGSAFIPLSQRCVTCRCSSSSSINLPASAHSFGSGPARRTRTALQAAQHAPQYIAKQAMHAPTCRRLPDRMHGLAVPTRAASHMARSRPAVSRAAAQHPAPGTLTAEPVALQAGHPQVRHAAVGAPGWGQRAGELVVVQAPARQGSAHGVGPSQSAGSGRRQQSIRESCGCAACMTIPSS